MQESKRKTMTARYAGQQESCTHFPFTENFESFCQIKNDVN